MADLGVPEVGTEGHISKDQSRTAATQAITDESSTKTDQVATNESSTTKASRSRLLKLITNDTSTRATRARKSRRHLSAIDRDMMESSRRGDVAGVRYEDEKGLGGCRIQ